LKALKKAKRKPKPVSAEEMARRQEKARQTRQRQKESRQKTEAEDRKQAKIIAALKLKTVANGCTRDEEKAAKAKLAELDELWFSRGYPGMPTTAAELRRKMAR
jgi:hypothetical protein